MNTSEAAKRIIDGEIGVLGKYEYSWKESRFYARDLGSSERWWTTELPKADDWQIKKEPIKYSKYIWLNKEPAKDVDSSSPPHHYLFGTQSVSLSTTKSDKCNKRYKITVEECPENE